MYIAAVLTSQACHQLKQILTQYVDLKGYVFQTAAGMPLPHHMTINMNGFDNTLNNPELLGQQCNIKIDGIAYNHQLGICAARVISATSLNNIEINSINSIKHITLAMKPTSKPFFSNKLLWKTEGSDIFISIPPTTLQAQIEECQ